MSEPRPDTAAMLAHVGHIFGGLPEELRDSLIELAWTDARDGKLRLSRHFWTGELEELVDLAVRQNAKPRQNVYIGAALRGPDTARERRSSDKDFRALTAFYADFDRAGALEQAERLCLEKNIRATARVITGRRPHARGQLWWRLDASQTDPERCRKINRAIADALGGDVTVVNAGRVMRLAGSIAWPKKPGRIVEKTEFTLAGDGDPKPWQAEQIAQAFPPTPEPATTPSTTVVASRRHAGPSVQVDDLLATVAPGNWHAPMLRAVASLVGRGWSDEDILAKTAPYTLSGWTAEQTYAEVTGMIAGARRKGFANKPRAKRLVAGVEPAYQSDSLPRDQAVSELTTTITGWFDRAQALALARRELVKRYKSRFARKTPRDVAESLRAEVKAKYGVANLKGAPRLTIQAAAGLGKTEAVIAQIMSRRELWGLRIWMFVPTLDLAEKLAERFAELSRDPASAPGPKVRVMRGRLAEATDERGPREPKTMCFKPEAADLAGRLGINVLKTLCKSAAGRCEFYDHCPWIEQWGDYGPGVLIWSHEYLRLPKLGGFPPPDMAIVDESVVEAMTGDHAFAPDRLTERPTWASEAWADSLTDVLRRVHEALSSEEPVLDALRARKLDRKTLVDAAERAEGGEDGDTGVTPDMPQDEALERLSTLDESERNKLARLLRQLAKEIDIPRPHAHSAALRRNVEVMVDGRRERQNRLLIWWRRKLMLGKSAPILLIDADADIEINRRLFGASLEHVVIPVARNADVTQCHNSNFSRRAILAYDGASDQSKAQALRVLSNIKIFIERLSQQARLLVVCALPVRRAITGEKQSKLPLCCEWKGATISHFGRIKGVDIWKHYSMVLNIGREQPPPTAVEGLARAVWDDDPVPLNLTGSYIKTVRGYRIRDGTKAGVEVYVHPDTRVQRVLELKRERESLQAIDRIRLVHASEIKKVYIMGKLPLDVVVDRLVNMRDLLDGKGSRIDRAMRRGLGGLPLAPKILAQKWPDLFPSLRTAEREIIGKIKEISDSHIPPKSNDIYHCNLGVCEFRKADHGHPRGAPPWSKALVVADTPYFRARVRDVMGCELLWKHPPTCRVYDRNFGVEAR